MPLLYEIRCHKKEKEETMELRPYKRENAETILSWCAEERAFYKWTAGVMGNYPITAVEFQFVEKVTAFCAYDGEEPVGFFTLRYPHESKEELRFGFVIVNPEKRGMGYGREMLRLGLEYAFSQPGVKIASLGVFENNMSARRCYQAAGFQDTGKVHFVKFPTISEEWKCLELEIGSEQ